MSSLSPERTVNKKDRRKDRSKHNWSIIYVNFTAYKTHTLVLFLPKLTDNESNQLKGQLTLSKMSIALQNKKYNKSPGTDAFSRDFLKVFF